jgi:integrase
MTSRATACGTTLAEDAFVFSEAADAKRPWHPDTPTARFVRLRHNVGLDNVRLHDLRHMHATQLLAAGVPVRTVSGRLGHANAVTTLNVYGHFLEASDRQAAAVMGDLLRAT